MTVEFVRSFLGWCTVINWAFLIFWWLLFSLAHNWVQTLHGKWFRISSERFDEIHYSLMGGYKMLIIMFNLVPYLVLRLAI